MLYRNIKNYQVGIGKYSSLACSNTVYITSYYNNIAYYYVMVKSGNSITTNLLREQPTTEKNGVEITIRNIEKFDKYDAALEYIVFFPNIYIDGIDHYLNSSKLKRLNNIAIASKTIYHKLLLGNVLYPCNRSLLPKDVSDFLSSIYHTGIVIRFNIGELGITPNRENIIYTSDTIDKISSRVREAKKELFDLIKKHLCKDYQNLEEYYNTLRKNLYYDPITDSINTKYTGYYIQSSDIMDMDITYKGINLKDHLDTISIAYNTVLPNYKAVVSEDKIYTSKLINRLNGYQYIKAKKILSCNSRLTATIKAFLKDYYDDYTIIGEITKPFVESYLSSRIYELEPKRGHAYRDLIIDGVWESIVSKTKVIDFNTDPDYLSFKADLASNKVVVTTEFNEVILYKYDFPFSVRQPIKFTKFSNAVEYLKKLKKGVIIANMDADDSFWATIAKIKNFVFFKAKKSVIAEIDSLNLSFIINKEWLLKKDPLLNKVYTICHYFPKGISYDELQCLQYTLEEQLYDKFMVLWKYSTLEYNYICYCKTVGTIDPYTEYLCERLKYYLDKWKEAKSVLNSSITLYDKTLAAAIIMKTKAYRICTKAYTDVQKNKLLKVLCRK